MDTTMLMVVRWSGQVSLCDQSHLFGQNLFHALPPSVFENDSGLCVPG